MHLVYPPKFCIIIVSNFSWVITVVPREIQDNGYAKFGGGGGGGGAGREVNRVHYGLCENGESVKSVTLTLSFLFVFAFAHLP